MAWLGVPAAAFAQGALEWVEIDAALDAGGRATITYQVRWRTTGTMHGFYFQGEAASPQFQGGVAQLPGGRKVGLEIKPLEPGRWDIVLENGQAWGPGEATYVFSYQADLAAAGLVDQTTSPDGKPLVVLNWAPVQWDQPLEHETIAI